jgi:hypothetical protein
MKLTVDFGHPEVLLLCGTFLMGSHFTFGLSILIIGILGGMFRFGARVQKIQQEEESKVKALKEMNAAGEELGSALAGFFGSLSGNKKNNEGSIH